MMSSTGMMMMSFSVLFQLFVVDDTVLEEHFEDPALVQIRLIGDGGKYKS